MNKKVTDLNAFTAEKERKQNYERLLELHEMTDVEYARDPSYGYSSREDEIHDLILEGADLPFEAWCEGQSKAKQAGLSHLGICLAGEMARCDYLCKSLDEVKEFSRGVFSRFIKSPDEGRVTFEDLHLALDEVNQAGLFPWRLGPRKGSGIV